MESGLFIGAAIAGAVGTSMVISSYVFKPNKKPPSDDEVAARLVDMNGPPVTVAVGVGPASAALEIKF